MSIKSDLYIEHQPEWGIRESESLTGSEVFLGLVNHGLFADKLPPCFVSKGLSDRVPQCFVDFIDGNSKKTNKYRRDYIQYQSLRDINIPRNIGIPHPESYIVQCLSIKKFWEEILEHCNRPSLKFTRIYPRRLKGGAIFEMNYRGVERYENEENKMFWGASASYIVKADIKACFSSIYTHSIPWALHGKQKAKEDQGHRSFSGNLIDRCTQNTRDGQTNGLLIGPHASNIISEIILTSIDCELQKKGYRQVARYVDDYTFYAKSYQEAENFIRDLNMLLRYFEMSLNEKKTKIIKAPAPGDDDWVLALRRYQLPYESLEKGKIPFGVVRSFLDYALELSKINNKSSPISYAIKVLFNKNDVLPLTLRAKRLYVQMVINLSLSYPYLAPLLGEYVFERYWYSGVKLNISSFVSSLIDIGIKRIYPDAISHAIYYSLRYGVSLNMCADMVKKIVEIDDCISMVLLYEYGRKHTDEKIKGPIKDRVENKEDKEEGG